MGIDNSVWLYRAMPMAPIADALTPDDSVAAMEPLMQVVDELAMLAHSRAGRRGASKSTYREIHILVVNIPRKFRPDRSHPLSDYLTRSFPTRAVDRRVALIGVKLLSDISGGGFVGAIHSVADTLISGSVPLSAYDQDYERIGSILSRSSMRTPTSDEYGIANAWWNNGNFPDTTMLVHADHIHIFASEESAQTAARLGEANCAEWPEIESHVTITMGSVTGFDGLPFVDASEPLAHWGSSLIEQGAVAISIRSLIEPAALTGKELRRRRQQYTNDLIERETSRKMNRAEQDEMLMRLGEVEAEYALGGPPTFHDCSIEVAFAGRDEQGGYNLADIGQAAGLSIWTMRHRQDSAMAESMLCSGQRSNPYLHDLPVQTIAASGISSLSVVGDRSGALVGFSERDQQPAYLSPTAASSADGLPMCLVAGQTGSGKTLLMLWLADQIARIKNSRGENTPVVIVDPKQGSAHDAAVLASGGRVYSLDSLMTADGVFDPIRFSKSTDTGVEIAASMLMSINPWGDNRSNYETPLTHALAYGVREGARCTGEALEIAKRDLPAIPSDMVDRVLDLAESSPMFRACVGVEPHTDPLKVSGGITLIKVGEGYFNLPEPGAGLTATQQQRISLALIRMCVFGSAMAVAGRSGVVMLDEAWIFLGAGRAQVEELGRVARSQGVLPMLFTQRVTDAQDAELSGYISRGLILPMQDHNEATAACELFKIAPTKERLARITAKDSVGGGADGSTAPNWSSMRALRDKSGKVLRGSIAIYSDLDGRAVPVEISIPQAFFAKASTNPDDIAKRLRSDEPK